MLLSSLLPAASLFGYQASMEDSAGQQQPVVWPSTPREEMPFSVSSELTRIAFTGRFPHYGNADT
jgi:hypothetical protein